MKRHDLVGKRFGSLLVLEYIGNTPVGHANWKCECDCGTITTRTGTSLIRSRHSSCGCWSKGGIDGPYWKGCGEISKNWYYNVIARAASGRKSRKLIKKEIDITIEYLWELFLSQNRKCSLTGIELSFPKTGNNRDMKEATASLDRIDSTKGYLMGNVQFVHKKINLMKNILPQDEFISFCKLVANNCGGGNCEII